MNSFDSAIARKVCANVTAPVKLCSLGSLLEVFQMEQWPFIPGRLYNRQRDIHERFGGQQRGGISTPQDAPGVFIFTGAAGAKHGYADSWQPDGSFHYCGEGQSGDMRLIRGNRAIASHAGLSRDLLLFETTGKGRPVRYVGQFVCAGWFTESLPDTEGLMRNALIFKLVPLAASAEAVNGAIPEQPSSTEEFNKLRMRAYAAAKAPSDVAPKSAVSSYFVRSQVIRDYALARASGNCERCGCRFSKSIISSDLPTAGRIARVQSQHSAPTATAKRTSEARLARSKTILKRS